MQEKRYGMYEDIRKENIERCIEKRKELIANSKKIIKPQILKRNKSYDDDFEDLYLRLNDYNNELINNNEIRKSQDNYILRKNYSSTKKFVPKKKYIITKNSYIINKSNGGQSKITKEELENFDCIKEEKKKYKNKYEKKDDFLMRYLKAELERAQKIKNIREKLEEKDEKLKKYMKIKKIGMNMLENGRYQDNQNIHERQKIYEKMLTDYDQKVYLSKQQQKEQKNSFNLNKSNIDFKKKTEELSKQINEYEKKNNEYKQKITKLFELKNKEEIDNLIKDRIAQKDIYESPIKKETSSYLMGKKIHNLKEKLEIEKYRRENALIENMKNYQNKINTILKNNDKKEKMFQKALLDAEKEREKERMVKNDFLKLVKQNMELNEIKKENKRQELLNKIEINNLKDFAIKQEKFKMFDENRKMSKINDEERKALKLKIQDIINAENNIAEGEKTDELFKIMLNDKNDS